MSVRECALGRGLFADRAYRTGEEILRFQGRTVSQTEVEQMGTDECYMIQIGPDLYFEPEPPGRYTNHSCAPNAAIKDDYRLIALADIQPNEQICFDYSTTMSEDNWTMECRCGASNCRGVIRDFGELPGELQRRYLEINAVQSFIVNELRDGRKKIA
jgi:SET domain-containing protein